MTVFKWKHVYSTDSVNKKNVKRHGNIFCHEINKIKVKMWYLMYINKLTKFSTTKRMIKIV